MYHSSEHSRYISTTRTENLDTVDIPLLINGGRPLHQVVGNPVGNGRRDVRGDLCWKARWASRTKQGDLRTSEPLTGTARQHARGRLAIYGDPVVNRAVPGRPWGGRGRRKGVRGYSTTAAQPASVHSITLLSRGNARARASHNSYVIACNKRQVHGVREKGSRGRDIPVYLRASAYGPLTKRLKSQFSIQRELEHKNWQICSQNYAEHVAHNPLGRGDPGGAESRAILRIIRDKSATGTFRLG